VLRHLCSNTLDELIEIDFIVIFNLDGRDRIDLVGLLTHMNT
jgi:hypothetical protein